ncbi:MAG: hypothetical protein R3222_02080 [Balneolaceae bacterium]|nr:hypothetical protein [Balneolaceae bacterium]
MSRVDKDRIGNFVSDLHSLEKHVLNAIQKQKESDKIQEISEAVELLDLLEDALTEQSQRLNQAAVRYDSAITTELKSKLAGFAGSLAGLVDGARKDPVSKLMRDNYTALSMLAAGHTMLKATALAADDEDLQHIAGNHLAELAQLVTEVSRVLPLSVVRELLDDPEQAEEIGQLAIEKTQKAWKGENIREAPEIV